MKIDELMQKYNCQSVDFLNIDFGNDKLFLTLKNIIPKKTINYFCDLAVLVDLAHIISDYITNSKDSINIKSANEIINFRKREEKLKQSYDKIVEAYNQLQNGQISINQFKLIMNSSNIAIKTLFGNLSSKQYIDLYYDKVNSLNVCLEEYRFVVSEIDRRLKSLQDFNSMIFAERHKKQLNGINRLLSDKQLMDVDLEQSLSDFFKLYITVINIVMLNILNKAKQIGVCYKNRQLIDSEDYISFNDIIFDLKEIAKKIQTIDFNNECDFLTYLNMLEYIKNILKAYIYSQQIKDLTEEEMDFIKDIRQNYFDKNVINLNSLKENITKSIYFHNVKIIQR